MLFKIKNISLLLVIGVIFILFNKVYARPYDGDYNGQLNFNLEYEISDKEKNKKVENIRVSKKVEVKKVVIKEVEIKVKEEPKQEVANVKDSSIPQYRDTIKKVRNADEAVYELNVILRQIEMYIVIKENILTKKNLTRKERVLSRVSKEIERLKFLADS